MTKHVYVYVTRVKSALKNLPRTFTYKEWCAAIVNYDMTASTLLRAQRKHGTVKRLSRGKYHIVSRKAKGPYYVTAASWPAGSTRLGRTIPGGDGYPGRPQGPKCAVCGALTWHTLENAKHSKVLCNEHYKAAL